MRKLVLLVVLAAGLTACASHPAKYGDSPRKACGCDVAAPCSDCCGVQDCRCSPNRG